MININSYNSLKREFIQMCEEQFGIRKYSKLLKNDPHKLESGWDYWISELVRKGKLSADVCSTWPNPYGHTLTNCNY